MADSGWNENQGKLSPWPLKVRGYKVSIRFFGGRGHTLIHGLGG